MNKKMRAWIFLAESVIVVALVVVITFLINEDSNITRGAELVEETVNEESNLSFMFEVDQVSTVSAKENTEEAIEETVGEVEEIDAEETEIVSDIEETETEETEQASDSTQDVIVSSTLPDITGDGEVSIVVFGDSIWDDDRGENNIAEQIQEQTGAIVYNCAIGGTAAAVTDGSTEITTWDNRSVNGMLYVARGQLSSEFVLSGYDAKEVIDQVDFTTVDYVIFSYGLNDYFCGTPLDGSNSMYDLASYGGALRHVSNQMQIAFPQAEYIIISPTYCKVYDGKDEIGTNDEIDKGYGTIVEYVAMGESVAEETGINFIDMYNDSFLNSDTIDLYLKDGVHFNEEGRTLYAAEVIEFIENME
ncbi:MAG: GDSL-type esterase/lipase family protein [Eubacteriales bacterium]